MHFPFIHVSDDAFRNTLSIRLYELEKLKGPGELGDDHVFANLTTPEREQIIAQIGLYRTMFDAKQGSFGNMDDNQRKEFFDSIFATLPEKVQKLVGETHVYGYVFTDNILTYSAKLLETMNQFAIVVCEFCALTDDTREMVISECAKSKSNNFYIQVFRDKNPICIPFLRSCIQKCSRIEKEARSR